MWGDESEEEEVGKYEDSSDEEVNTSHKAKHEGAENVKTTLHLHNITLPCILYSVKDIESADRQAVYGIPEQKYNIDVSEENVIYDSDQELKVSYICHPTQEQACDIIGDEAQIVRFAGANRGSEAQKLGPLFKVFEHVLGMISNRIDLAEDKIDSSASEVMDSIRQLREAIERMDERNTARKAGAAWDPDDKCVKAQVTPILSDWYEGNFHDQSDHGALVRRNLTQEFSPSEEIPPPYEEAVLTNDGDSSICADLVNALSTLQQSESGMFDDNSYTDDETNTEKNGYDKAAKITEDVSWEIEPDVWQECTRSKNQNMVYELLQQRKLPNRKSLEDASAEFGRTSEVVSDICSSICAYLREKSENIVDVWPAYQYNKNEKDRSNHHITFVVIKENDTHIDLGDFYSTYERTCTQFNSESKEVNEMESNAYKLFDANMKALCECVNRSSSSLMAAHSNLTMVTASWKTSHGFGTAQHTIEDKLSVVLYAHIKGLVPLGEDPFPSRIGNFPVDVREAVFVPMVGGRPNEYHDFLKMGCAIRNENIDQCGNCSAGTLGGFLNHPSYGMCCITCAHVLFDDVNSFQQFENGVKYWTASDTDVHVFQPCCLGAPSFGKVVCAVFKAGDGSNSGVDAALVKITTRHPVDGCFPDTQTFEDSGFTMSKPMLYSNGKICPREKLEIGRVVIKYGCDTEVTRGVFRLKCGTVRKSHAVGQHRGIGFLLHSQIEILSAGEVDFSRLGDSGALVFVEENEELFVIGLLVGGMGDGRYLVTPIEDILRSFDLPLEGTFIRFPCQNIPASPSFDSLLPPRATFRCSSPLPPLRSTCTSRSDSAVSMSMSEESSALCVLFEDKFKVLEEKVKATDEDITQEVAKHATEIKEELNKRIDIKLEKLKAELKGEIQQSHTLLERQMQEQNKNLQDFLAKFFELPTSSRPSDHL